MRERKRRDRDSLCEYYTTTHLVDVAQHHLLHALVLHHLPHHPTIPAANDQHPLGARVTEEREVRDHLLVGELVPLCALDHAVEDQDFAPRLGPVWKLP